MDTVKTVLNSAGPGSEGSASSASAASHTAASQAAVMQPGTQHMFFSTSSAASRTSSFRDASSGTNES